MIQDDEFADYVQEVMKNTEKIEAKKQVILPTEADKNY